MNAHAGHLADDAPRRLLSVQDFSRMIEAGIIGDDENVELIDGELIQMAAKKFAHEYLKSCMVRHFNRACTEDVFVGIEVSLRLDTHTLVEPDILITRQAETVPGPEGYIGLPGPRILLLVEVADSTLRKDRGRKARLYGRYQIPEYWIVDTNRRLIWRHREPGSAGYGVIEKIVQTESVVPAAAELAQVAVRLADFAR